MITLEYILIKGINDDLKQAELLGKNAKRLHARINLIPYNSVDGLEWKRSSKEQIIAIKQKVEIESPPRLTLHMERGHDIEAAFGQLRL